MRRDTIKEWIDDNPKPKRKDYKEHGHQDGVTFREAKDAWNEQIRGQRRTLNDVRTAQIEIALGTAKEAVISAALRAIPGEEKRDAAIHHVLLAIDKALTFPETLWGKIAELGTDWFIYHPMRHLAERAVDRAYAKLVRESRG